MVHGVQVIVLAVPNPDDHPHGVSRHLLRAADELVTLSPSKVDSTVMREDVIRQGPTVLEIEMAMPVEPWEDEIDTAPHVGAFPAEDDERQQLQAGIREELNGWLDEMAWDDI